MQGGALFFREISGGVEMELPQRKRNRLEEFDYSTPNAYFITVCTQNRKNLFWQGVGCAGPGGRARLAPTGDADVGASLAGPESVPLSEWGEIVDWAIRRIPTAYPMICLERYVIMPNHIHLLLRIESENGGPARLAPTISEVVRQTKGLVSKTVGTAVWQKGFYDHVVRSEDDFRDIWQYIEGNPSKWAEDELFC